jgi:hypothetical protein
MGKFTKSAWEILKTKNPSNNELIYVIKCENEQLKKEAWEIIKNKNPENTDLRLIIAYCRNEEIKNEAW